MGEIEAQGASVYMITALCPTDQDRVRTHKWQNENSFHFNNCQLLH